MKLTPEQRDAVSQWIAAGETLANVQRRLSSEFKISMTYMDVRFLVDDLGLELKSAAPAAKNAKADLFEKTPAPQNHAAPEPHAEDSLPEENFPEDEALPEAAPPPTGSSVKVDLDRVMRPGTLVSGNVTFSDGKTAKWAMDQFGRLMLDGAQGYKPSQPDIQAFQVELSALLQRSGYG